MSKKYELLGKHLKTSNFDRIEMTFDEVEDVIGSALPRSKVYPAWWSNNPSNNPMTKVWLTAGYRTEQVDIEGCKLVFRRDTENSGSEFAGMAEAAGGEFGGRHPLVGCMKGLMTIAPGTDLTEPADPEWADMLEDDAASASSAMP